jgi:hypothetical protein
MTNHPVNPHHTPPAHATFVQAARKLRELYDRPALRAAFSAFCWLSALVLVSAALAPVTGGVYKRVVPDPNIAFLLGVLVHLSLGLATEIWFVGGAKEDSKLKAVGLTFLLLILAILGVTAAARAIVMMDAGRSALFAWSLSFGVLLLEAAIPILLGIVFAGAWLARSAAHDEAEFYRQFAKMIETAQSPSDRWNDAEDRQEQEIKVAQSLLPTASPEQHAALQARITRCTRRWFTLMEWNPGRAFQRPSAPVLVVERKKEGDTGRPQPALPAADAAPSADGVPYYG